jgi:hypothetical protein
VWRKARATPGTTLIRRQARSAVVLFEDGAIHRKKYQQWLGNEVVAVLEAPDRVEAYAIRPWLIDHPREGHENDPPAELAPGVPTAFDGYPIYAAGPPLDKSFAMRLVEALLDDRAFEPSDPPFSLHRVLKGCSIAPGVGFRLWSGNRTVDVLLCFHCDQIEIGPIPGRRGRSSHGHGDIDDARAMFVALAKEALPDVPEITSIPAIRRER